MVTCARTGYRLEGSKPLPYHEGPEFEWEGMSYLWGLKTFLIRRIESIGNSQSVYTVREHKTKNFPEQKFNLFKTTKN